MSDNLEGLQESPPGSAAQRETSSVEASRSGLRPGAISELLVELAKAPEGAAEERSWPHLSAGTVVGRFELVREIGHGSFGQVWEAIDRELDRPVAFKLWRPGRVRKIVARKRS